MNIEFQIKDAMALKKKREGGGKRELDREREIASERKR